MTLTPAERTEDDSGHSRRIVDSALASMLSKRMPFVYAIVIINLLLIANAFFGTVSNLHLTLATAPLVVIGVVRAIHWHPRLIGRRAPEKITRDLNLLPWTGTAFATGLMLVVLSLYPFGNLQQQSLIHYIATLTSFIGILGLNPSPRTAVGMTLVSVLPSTAMFLYFQHPNAAPISMTMVSVSFLLLLIARTQHQSLIDLILSKHALQQRESEASLLNERLHRQAYFDDLTNIANRRSFFESFEAQLTRTNSEPPWLGLIDLDGFKTVNDLFGHRSGDAVLQAVADRLTAFPDVMGCGRLGGDEFGFLLSGALDKKDAFQRSEELALLIAKPIPNGSQMLTVRASIGLRKTTGLSANESVERADWALYKAKLVRGSVVIFSADDELVFQEKARITQQFDIANLANELRIAYQPIVDFDSGQIQSVEVLARWQAADGSLVMPDVFVPMAESTQRTCELAKIIIAKSLQELPTVYSSSFIHINLSANDITDEELLDWLLNCDLFKGIPRTRIFLEITETAFLVGGMQAAENLAKLRAVGFRIALDDFGVGQSSLSRIHKLPLDQIKIDKSFCIDDASNEFGWAITSTILALSRQLGLGCVLEGVETEAQALKARSLGVRLMQGYYFAHPMSALEHEIAPFSMSGKSLAKSSRARKH